MPRSYQLSNVAERVSRYAYVSVNGGLYDCFNDGMYECVNNGFYDCVKNGF